ncbi:unnamed protein product [Lactuca saligna]|uniref:Uncharacterized protein n=1 Tax=Lactuca saligna TaxID=75948 RepID=A0AA36E4Y8_LACSI|nr:unnamed protein product [Lactuca saligna]
MDLETVDDCEQDYNTLIKWKEQHPKITKSAQAPVDLIEQSQIANEMFVLNFIVLFVNSIIKKTTSGYIETRSLLKLTKVENKENINWCKRIRPLHFWNYGRLKTRQTNEIANGKFGMVQIFENMEKIEDDEEEYVDLDKEESEKNKEEFLDSYDNDDIGVEII